jgi:phage-related protein
MSDNKEEKKTSPDYKQFSEFGGIIDLELNIRLPDSYYEAAREYCNVANIPVREWLNAEILDAIEAIELGHVTGTFIKKYHLRSLSRDKREAMIQAHRMFTLKEETLNDG